MGAVILKTDPVSHHQFHIDGCLSLAIHIHADSRETVIPEIASKPHVGKEALSGVAEQFRFHAGFENPLLLAGGSKGSAAIGTQRMGGPRHKQHHEEYLRLCRASYDWLSHLSRLFQRGPEARWKAEIAKEEVCCTRRAKEECHVGLSETGVPGACDFTWLGNTPRFLLVPVRMTALPIPRFGDKPSTWICKRYGVRETSGNSAPEWAVLTWPCRASFLQQRGPVEHHAD